MCNDSQACSCAHQSHVSREGCEHARKLASSACLEMSSLCLGFTASWLGWLCASPAEARFARLLRQGGPWWSVLLGFLV